jgi:hypothetical protein
MGTWWTNGLEDFAAPMYGGELNKACPIVAVTDPDLISPTGFG